MPVASSKASIHYCNSLRNRTVTAPTRGASNGRKRKRSTKSHEATLAFFVTFRVTLWIVFYQPTRGSDRHQIKTTASMKSVVYLAALFLKNQSSVESEMSLLTELKIKTYKCESGNGDSDNMRRKIESVSIPQFLCCHPALLC